MQNFILTLTLTMSLISQTNASAGSNTTRVNAIGDWSIFVADNPKECWAATTYKKTEYIGQKINRQEVLFMVFIRPKDNINQQPTYKAGVELQAHSVNLKIGDKTFPLVVNGEWANSPSAASDKSILDALIHGQEATIAGTSLRNNMEFSDHFSLNGSAAAILEATSYCADKHNGSS